MIQHLVDRAYAAFLHAWRWPSAYRRERARWAGEPPAGSGIRVFYGYETMPGTCAPVAGGIVKTLDLARSYPNTPEHPGILYLVSSALPPFAELMVREARAHGAKLVWNQNGVAYPAWYGTGWRHANGTMRRLIQAADYVFYQSDFCRISADRFLGARKGPYEVLHNPVDTDVFRPAVAAGGTSEPLILVAGSHHQWYRIQSALEAFARAKASCPGLRLQLAGRYLWCRDEAEALREVHAHIAALGVGESVSVMGSYTQEEAVALMQRSHMLLHTKYNDPCPRVVVEAMACGLPVVYSASGGVPELVGPEAGVGVAAPVDWEQDHPPGPEPLAAGVLSVLRQLDTMSCAARLRAVSHLDVTHWMERHRRQFEALCTGSGA